MSEKSTGAICIALATVIYGILPVLIRITFDEGSNGPLSCFLRFALALPVLLPVLIARGTGLRLTAAEARLLFWAGSIGTAGTTYLLNYSFAFIPVGMAATLHFIYPILVSLACVLLFRDRMDVWKVLALAAGVAGVAAFFERGAVSIPGIALALVSGGTYAAYIVLVDKTALVRMDFLKLTFYLCLFAAPVSLAGALAEGRFAPENLTAKGWLVTILFSLGSTVGALVLFQLGVKRVGSATAAIMSTIEPITSVLLGILILGEDVTAAKAIGCALIVTSIVLISRSGGGAAQTPFEQTS